MVSGYDPFHDRILVRRAITPLVSSSRVFSAKLIALLLPPTHEELLAWHEVVTDVIEVTEKGWR